MVVNSPVIPVPGETVIGGNFAVYQGGKGANQAVAAARAGADVIFIACVGNDPMGNEALAGYEKERINTSTIQRVPNTATGVAVILVNETDGQNSILVTPGANNHLTESQIKKAEHFFTKDSILLAQLEVPLDAVESGFRLAKTKGMQTILNPAPARPLPDALLNLTDIITPNETETEKLTGVYPGDEESLQSAAEQLLKKVNEAVIITLGDKGAYYLDKAGSRQFVSAVEVANVIDTTAAGDVFNGYLAAGLLAGRNISEALKLANVAAAKSIQLPGAQPSIPHFSDV